MLRSSGYYLTSCDPMKNRTWHGKDERAFRELSFHLVRSTLASVVVQVQTRVHMKLVSKDVSKVHISRVTVCCGQWSSLGSVVKATDSYVDDLIPAVISVAMVCR